MFEQWRGGVPGKLRGVPLKSSLDFETSAPFVSPLALKKDTGQSSALGVLGVVVFFALFFLCFFFFLGGGGVKHSPSTSIRRKPNTPFAPVRCLSH